MHGITSITYPLLSVLLVYPLLEGQWNVDFGNLKKNVIVVNLKSSC